MDIWSIYLVQVDFVKVKPFADEDDDGSTELVRPALVETSNPRDFGQILRFGTTEQSLVPFVMLKIGSTHTNN